MSRGDLEELEKRIRFVFLKACRLPKSLSKELIHLAALCALATQTFLTSVDIKLASILTLKV